MYCRHQQRHDKEYVFLSAVIVAIEATKIQMHHRLLNKEEGSVYVKN
jgi:hypothetical protein